MIRITDKKFVYTPSFATDLRKKFRKLELERKRASQEKPDPEPTPNVTVLKRAIK